MVFYLCYDLEIYFFKHLYSICIWIAFIFSILLSVFIVCEEIIVIVGINSNIDLKAISWVRTSTSGYIFVGFIGVIFLFTSYTSFIGILYLRMFKVYGFWNKRTDISTLVNSAIYMSRITPALISNLLVLTLRSNSKIFPYLGFTSVAILLIIDYRRFVIYSVSGVVGVRAFNTGNTVHLGVAVSIFLTRYIPVKS